MAGRKEKDMAARELRVLNLEALPQPRRMLVLKAFGKLWQSFLVEKMGRPRHKSAQFAWRRGERSSGRNAFQRKQKPRGGGNLVFGF
jgi:hypothetical protein